MKRQFEIPEAEVTYFQTEDIITSSGEQPEGPGNENNTDWDD